MFCRFTAKICTHYISSPWRRNRVLVMIQVYPCFPSDTRSIVYCGELLCGIIWYKIWRKKRKYQVQSYSNHHVHLLYNICMRNFPLLNVWPIFSLKRNFKKDTKIHIFLSINKIMCFYICSWKYGFTIHCTIHTTPFQENMSCKKVELVFVHVSLIISRHWET